MSQLGADGSTVVLSGVAGFIGFHLTKRLLKAGATVAGLDNLNSYYDVGLKMRRLDEIGAHPRFSFVKMDLEDHDDVLALFAKLRPDIVIHLAAQAGVRYSLNHPRSYVASNVDGFLAILEAARAHPVKHLIYASSSSVYGANTKVPFHEDDPVLAPVSLYAATKRANELMAQTYAHLYRIPCSGLRFFTVYGPWGRPDMAYYSFAKAILEDRPIDVYNHGKMRRDFTYIDDVTEAIIRLLWRPPCESLKQVLNAPPHIIYNVGNHTPIELSEFIATIESALGRKAQKRLQPMQPGDVPTTYADVERLTRVTGFAPNTTISEGISKFVTWFRSYHNV